MEIPKPIPPKSILEKDDSKMGHRIILIALFLLALASIAWMLFAFINVVR